MASPWLTCCLEKGMTRKFAALSDFLTADYDTIIDVRAPSEFATDHVPGAINLPVLSDCERAEVGTIYKQVSPFAARKLGAALVARNAADHIAGPLAEKEGAWRPLVYCWRGGQRSNSFASILAQIGWRVDVVEGGYKAWRRLVLEALHKGRVPHRIVLLDGNTGTAKTEILARVAALGGQVLDLEALARHRGSIFGEMGDQPAQTGFESALVADLLRLDPARPVLIEAESSRVGQVSVPPALWSAMCAAPRIEVTAPLSARAWYLSETYGDLASDAGWLEARLDQLVSLQGHARVDAWQKMAQAGAFSDLAGALMAEHYDPRYAKSRARHAPEIAATVALADMSATDFDRAAEIIFNFMSCA